MKAEYTGEHKGATVAHWKDGSFSQSYIALVIDDWGNTVHEVVNLRLYQTKTAAYCRLFVNSADHGITATGSGKAGGYGYNRQSAAASEAISNAGFMLSETIDGQGDKAVREAVKAIGERVAPTKRIHIINAHG